MFIKRTGGTQEERYVANVNLAGFEAIVGQQFAVADDYSVGLGMSAMLVNGKQPINGNDSYQGMLALSDFQAIVADNIGTSSDSYTPTLALSAFVAVTAQVGSTKVDDAVVGIGLSAFII